MLQFLLHHTVYFLYLFLTFILIMQVNNLSSLRSFNQKHSSIFLSTSPQNSRYYCFCCFSFKIYCLIVVTLKKTLDLNIDELINYFCGMVDWRKAFRLISSQGHCQRSSLSWISDSPRAGFEPAQSLSSGFVEWSLRWCRQKDAGMFLIKRLETWWRLLATIHL